MPRRHPSNIVQIGLRVRESLRRKLEHEAKRHRVSLNREVEMRVEDSFENKDAPRDLHDITRQMQLVWIRLATAFEASELEDEIISALAQGKDPKEVIKLVRDWLRHRDVARHMVVPDSPDDMHEVAATTGMPARSGQPKWKPHWQAPNREEGETS